MKVLVAVASRHGATDEIAQVIGKVLAERGVSTSVTDVRAATGVRAYDAVVLGSAVYNGRWMQSALDFATIYKKDLLERPVWLFSSGPVGEQPRPAVQEAVHIEHVFLEVHAREHRLFGGRLDKSKLSFGERALASAVRAPEGDFRDWGEITAWATMIADQLKAERK